MEGSFDHWTSLFLLVTGTGIFLFFILLSSAGFKKQNLPIAVIVLLFSLTIFEYVLIWTKYQHSVPYFGFVPAVTYFSIGPLLYFYFSKIFNQKIKGKLWLHLLPAIGVLIPEIMIWIYSATGEWFFGNFGNTLLRWRRQLFNPYLQIGHMAIYVSMLWWMVFQKKKTEQSENQKVLTRWATFLIRLNVVFILALLSYYILVQFPFFNRQWDYMICMTMSFSIYAIGFFVFKQPAIFNGEAFQHLFLPKKSNEPILKETTVDVFSEKIILHLKNNKPYLDADLRLTTLADQLGFTSHLLSQIINEKFGKNFNQFINDFRLKEAERLLVESPQLSIKDIYYQVGFNNKATFYQVFKNKHQITPTQFRVNPPPKLPTKRQITPPKGQYL